MKAKSGLTRFHNCYILRNSKIIKEDLWIRDGKIVNPEQVFYVEQVEADVTVNCENSLIAPGFIDIQNNGGWGVDFSYDSENVEEGVQKVAKALLAHGVTSFCPTMVTSDKEKYSKILPRIQKHQGSQLGASILGVHLEGPFISLAKKGAHKDEYIQNPEKFHHRDPGLVGLLASTTEKQVYYGIISDGIHTHPAALRIACRTNPDGLILVSDAVAAQGLADGNYRIGPQSVNVENGRAYITGTKVLCGSTTALDECVKTLKEATDCSLEYALETASLHPAKALGIDHIKGKLNFGHDADFVIIHPKLMKVLSTWIAGECVYKSS
ncbi:N-acetylglucosamine-6-phosphate deacetylase isoform X2 [Vanessa tameamea]|uniref:N-acetylglucosamine-6-phosphate deacetylase isoform X2 n=1 Tax=Vanessa tameamea TaxID=334116 RepID=A0ABM4ASN7_VANTA